MGSGRLHRNHRMGERGTNGDQARSLRTARLRDLGADQFDVGEFELAIAHLRVPELIYSRVVFASPRSTLEQVFAQFLALASISA